MSCKYIDFPFSFKKVNIKTSASLLRAHTKVWRSQGVALQHYRFTPHAPQFFTCIISLWQGSSGKKQTEKMTVTSHKPQSSFEICVGETGVRC